MPARARRGQGDGSIKWLDNVSRVTHKASNREANLPDIYGGSSGVSGRGVRRPEAEPAIDPEEGQATSPRHGVETPAPVPSGNNHGERQIRPAVIARKHSYANGSEDGAETQALLMSVFRTLKHR